MRNRVMALAIGLFVGLAGVRVADAAVPFVPVPDLQAGSGVIVPPTCEELCEGQRDRSLAGLEAERLETESEIFDAYWTRLFNINAEREERIAACFGSPNPGLCFEEVQIWYDAQIAALNAWIEAKLANLEAWYDGAVAEVLAAYEECLAGC